MTRETILAAAARLTAADRHEEYGNAQWEFEKVATCWSWVFNTPVRPEDVPLAMAFLKLVRETHKHKPDNLIDGCGYLHIRDQMLNSQL